MSPDLTRDTARAGLPPARAFCWPNAGAKIFRKILRGIFQNSAPLAVCTALATPGSARDLPLRAPIACEIGATCYVQNLVDHDPSPGFADFLCGPMGYDGHKGTDFALPYLSDLENGVDVLAAAPGIVRGVRDGMPDIGIRDENAPALEGRDCGNGVVLDHGGGWETQYCHLKMGSVAVEPGQRVTAGRVLGQVGLSGRTEFPHLHLSVRHDGRVVDPFSADDLGPRCGGDARTLWVDPVPLRPGGLLDAGFLDRVPDYDDLKARDIGLETAPTDTPALVVWGYFFGARKGDEIAIAITGPGGFSFSATQAIEKDQALGFRAGGRRNTARTLEAGLYKAEIRMIRDGNVLESRTAQVTLTSP